MYLKSATKNLPEEAVKITLQYKVSSAFCEKKKISVKKKISAIKKIDLSISCLLKESASILEQASRSYGGLKLGVFMTK